MKRTLFIDRDGTILAVPPDGQVDSLEKLVFLPGVISALSKIATETDYELVMVSGHDRTGSPSFPVETFSKPQEKMLQILEGERIIFKEIFIDQTSPEETATARKPVTAMLTKYLARGIDLQASYVIGDRLTDLELAKNLGCNAIYINEEPSFDAILCTTDWEEIYRFLKSVHRSSSVVRKTSETSVAVTMDIDGTGKSSVNTGIGFFDHLLDQIARHACIDMTIMADGDLNHDEHHVIEDVAITLGKAISEALGSKRGVERYGFLLPMDDCLATVALDFGGRPWLLWDATFKREKIGEMPAEMFFHFFKSLSDNAKCNLNIKAEGANEHHKIESIFKAFGRALKMAVKHSGNNELPTTKGSL